MILLFAYRFYMRIYHPAQGHPPGHYDINSAKFSSHGKLALISVVSYVGERTRLAIGRISTKVNSSATVALANFGCGAGRLG